MPITLVEKNCTRFEGRDYFLQVVPANTIPQKPRPNLNNPVRNFMCQKIYVFKNLIPLKSFGAASSHLLRFLSNIWFA